MDEHAILKEYKKLTKEETAVLVEKYKSGDSEAGLKLIRSQGPWIRSIVGDAKIHPSVEMDDVLSDITVTLLQSLKYFNPEKSSLSTFVSNILSRRLPRMSSVPNRRELQCSESDLHAEEDHRAQYQGIGLENEEELEVVTDIIRTHLPDTQRRILIDWLNDWPMETIADRENERIRAGGNEGFRYTHITVSDTIERAISTIRVELAERGALALKFFQKTLPLF